MTRLSLTDEDCDRLVASRDPVDRSVLQDQAVVTATGRLHDALLDQPAHAMSRQPGRRPSSGRREVRFGHPRRRLVALAGILVAALGVVAATLALLPSGRFQDGQFGVTPADAAVALNRAAEAALRDQPVVPGPRQYAFLKVQTRSVLGGGPPDPGTGRSWIAWTWQSALKYDWYRANGSGRERIVRIGTGFLTARDRAVTEAHGMTLRQVLPPTPRVIDGAFPAGTLQTAGFLPYWRLLSPKGLPTQPHPLLLALERMLHSTAPSAPAPWRRDPGTMFGPVAQFLFLPTSPELRAALFRVLADLPGVKLLGWKRDHLGRRGLAVGLVDGGRRSRVREELLFDPATSEVLQTQSVQVTSSLPARALPLSAGTVIDYTVFLSRGVVNSISKLPDGRRLPLPRSSSTGATG